MTVLFNFVTVPAKQVRPSRLFDRFRDQNCPSAPVLPPSSGAPDRMPTIRPACAGRRLKGAGRRCDPPTSQRRPAPPGEAA
jgi:hypothetical protein